MMLVESYAYLQFWDHIASSGTVCKIVYLYKTVLWRFCMPNADHVVWSPYAIGLLWSMIGDQILGYRTENIRITKNNEDN